ncbi:MAG: DNA modification methylase [Parcubacteria group bacterium RIFCSPHIGHO2_01_FULL_45_26]|nr:MAG: DNA modification methylase [Parcubacteria group bacterium RIFCSPHIGHO2_01_FULL_45_26]
MKNLLDQIIFGDTLQTLIKIPPNSVDIGVTSPPYNKQENKKGWLVNNVKYNNVSDKSDELEYQQNQISVLNELFRIMKPGGSFFYNHKVRWEKGILAHPISWICKSKWTIRQEIIWDRMIAANIRGWRFWQIEERIYWLYKPISGKKIGNELLSKHALLTSIWRFPPERNNPHPAPFPVLLPLRCIYSLLDDATGGVILDPYMGSGSTAIAAKLLEHNFIGIDISKHYINLANDRLSKLSEYAHFLGEEKQRHFVKTTFKERKELGIFTGKFRKDSHSNISLNRTLEYY